MTDSAAVREQYGRIDVRERVTAALEAAGLGSGPVPWEQLGGLDQFHTGGLLMTRRLAAGLDLSPAASVLDVGAGVGGPARFLAATYGCHVTGVDLSPALVEVAQLLSERTGLAAQTTFRQGDATALPVADASFDRALSQHVAMNISDRMRFYTEVRRVVRPGGRVAFHDVTQGHAGPIQYPVPWARRPEASYVLTPEEMRAALGRAGFAELSFEDVTEETIELGRRRPGRDAGEGGSALSLGVVMGPEFAAVARNLQQNLEEGRARVVQVILRREAGA